MHTKINGFLDFRRYDPRGKRRKPKPAVDIPTIIEGVRSPQKIVKAKHRARRAATER